MAKCGHCYKIVKGIRDHIRDVHGYPYYCMGPDFKTYFGKNNPPYYQINNLPDKQILNDLDINHWKLFHKKGITYCNTKIQCQ